MASFNIPKLKTVLTTLKQCYGFDTIEILSELGESLKPYIDERRMDEIVWEQRTAGKKRGSLIDYALNIDGDVEIITSADYDKQMVLIRELCKQSIQDKEVCDTAKFILTFMTAIFDRDTYGSHADEIVPRLKKSWKTIHPDLLRLYIALNKPKHPVNTPIKIHFKTDTPHTIDNKSGWFSDLLNEFVRQMLGETTVEQAEQDLKNLYSDEKGRKGDNPYLNYIINGTYNFIRHFMPSDTVTVTQCKFLLEYLRIIEQVKEGDSIADINYLQSKVKSLISSKHTPVQKHVKSQSMRSILA